MKANELIQQLRKYHDEDVMIYMGYNAYHIGDELVRVQYTESDDVEPASVIMISVVPHLS